VLPSIYEPFGMVALEAAAAGAPLAVAATGGLTEIVEPGETGVTFPAKDPDGLAGAVSTLLADPPFAQRVAGNARALVTERYAWAAVARRTVAAQDKSGAPKTGTTSGKVWSSEGSDTTTSRKLCRS